MADEYLDELMDGGPSKRPTRTSRFLPKGCKPRKIPETESSVKMDIEVKPGVGVKSEVKKEEKDDLMETETETEELREDAATGVEDRIVREIDVHFAPSFDPNTQLYVLQYPLRPLWRPYELEERCEAVRVKPASSEVEVDLTVNVNSKNYDSGADPKSQPKQTLQSSWKPPHISGLSIGVLTGNKLYLNPAHAVVQLRPSLKHLNSKRKAAMSDNFEETAKAELAEGEPSVASNKLSKASMQNKDSGEGWVPLKYHDSKSDLSERYLKKMMAEEGSPIYFSSSHNYLDSLCGTLNDSSTSKGPPIWSLMKLPVKERFKTWLVTGPIHRFDVLKHLAPEESIENVLEILQEHAQLVQGLWVPKTRLLYPESSEIDFIRDYVFLLFSKAIFITNSQILQCPKYAEGIKNFLRTLAVERSTFNDWKLKEPADMNFIKLNPSVVEKQKGEWERTESRLTKFLRMGPGYKTSSKSSSNTNQVTSKSSSKVVTRISNGATPGSAMSEEAREDIKKALQELFKSINVCSHEQIIQRIRNMAVSKRSTTFAREEVAVAESIDTYRDELQAIVSQVAVNIHGIWVPKSSPNQPQYDPFRKVVIDLFVAEGPDAKLKRAQLLEAAKIELKREISNIEYQKVLQELCEVKQGSLWSLRTDANPKH